MRARAFGRCGLSLRAAWRCLVFSLLVAATACRPGEASAPQADAGKVTWKRLPPTASVPADRPLMVGFLVVDGVYNSELMAPWGIFHHTVFHVEPGMEVVAISPDGLPVVTFEGLEIVAHHGFDDAPQLDLHRGPSFVHDGPAITSKGGAKSYDPAIYLVDHLYGEQVARGVGRGMVIDWPPSADFGEIIP